MRRILAMGALLLASGWVLGCSDDETGRGSPSIIATEVVGSRLLFVDSRNEAVAWLDVAAKRPEPELRRAALPAEPIAVSRHAGRDDLLVLCRSSAESTQGEHPAALVVVDEQGIDRTYDLGTRYDTMAQSDDGRYVLLHTTADDGDVLFSNPNDITIVDTDARSGTPPMQRTLKTVSESPRGVVFSPELKVDRSSLRLAIVLYPSSATLIDLDHLDDATFPVFTIRLPSAAGLVQAVFSADEGRIYLRGEQSADLFLLQLVRSDAGTANWFEPVLNQIGMGSAIQDVMRFDLGSGERLLATAGRQVLLVDVGSSNVTRLDLGTNASRVLPFEQDGHRYAMLYAPNSSTVSFVDLSGLEDRPQHSVQHVSVQGGYSSLEVLTEREVLLQSGGAGLSVLDLYERTVAPIRAAVQLAQSPVFDAERRRVWLAPEASSTAALIDLDGLQPREVRLDATVERLLVVPHPDRPRVVAMHSGSLGYLTVLDAVEPSRHQAVSLRGYLQGGVFDRGDD